jgi:DNA-binding FadR family transcriptional regulator
MLAFQKISVLPAYHQVVDAIEAKILSGKLMPGDELGTESELVEQFGLNRSSIREGIHILEYAGVLSREKGRPITVNIPKNDTLHAQISRSLLLQRVTYKDLVECLSFLEVASVSSAMKKMTSATIKALRENIERSRASYAFPKKLAKLDVEFHKIMVEATQNSALIFTHEPMGRLIYASTQQIFEINDIGAKRMCDAHEFILDAIENENIEEAMRWMKRHVLDFENGLNATGIKFDEPVVMSAINENLDMR